MFNCIKRSVIMAFIWFSTAVSVSAAPVELIWASADFIPTGTGSHTWSATYKIRVDNIAYDKEVGIWGRNAGTGDWEFAAATNQESVSGNKEIWSVTNSTVVDLFTVRYTVNGVTHWDNNNSNNYALEAYSSTRMIGVPNVIFGGGRIDTTADTAEITIGVKNLAYHKVVGIVYTLDDWATNDVVNATYSHGNLPDSHPGQPEAETWQLSVPLVGASRIEFAIFYEVDGNTYWNNNYQRNFALER